MSHLKNLRRGGTFLAPRALALPAFCLALACLAPALRGQNQADAQGNWPQWRGPLKTGLAPQGNPPVQWSESKNVQWKVNIPGFGTSTPILWQDQVFILTAIKAGQSQTQSAANAQAAAAAAAAAAAGVEIPAQENRARGGGVMVVETPGERYQFTVLSLDRTTGNTLWQKIAREEVPHEGHHRDHGFASASPITDGTNLFAYFGSRGLHCFTMTGERKWSKDFGDMRTRNGFGEGSSPALHGDTLVINWDHEGDDFIVALDKHTGAEKWRKERDEPTSWSTPLIVEHEGKTQVVVNATGAVRAYDLENGDLIWECGGQTVNAIPTPVTGHGLLYAMSGFRGSNLQAIKLGRQGKLTDTEAVAWKHNRGTPYVPSPLLYGELLYFLK
ncbi:MAG TPA: PQQ-binding-like beta-propeller repeat protein, partial [Verrucomicrobiae bacterium]|nr:PQQ-binding-like beta-propeller repeat protein [Verrucomicrobiae bacterium]